MAFGRVLNIYVGDTVSGVCVDGPTLVQPGTMLQLVGTVPGLAGETLHASCEVHRSNKMGHNIAEIKVMNLNQETRKWLESFHGVVRVDAGYEDDGFGTIFYGQVDLARSTLTGGDWVTTINAYHFRAHSMQFETLLTAVSYDPGTSLQTVLKGLADILGVPLLGIDVSWINLEGGFADVGPMSKTLKRVGKILAGAHCGLYYDLAELRVFKKGTQSFDLDVLDWSLDTGLLTAKWLTHESKAWRKEVKSEQAHQKEQAAYNKSKSTDGRTRAAQRLTYARYQDGEAKRLRCEATGLVNHLARPNCPLYITHPAISADGKMFFIVDEIVYRLTNYGDQFDMTVFASRDPVGGGA